MAKIAGLGKLIEPGDTGIEIENAGVGFEEVGCPGVGGLLDSEMSSLVSFAAALRRSTQPVYSLPLRCILKVLSPRESTE